MLSCTSKDEEFGKFFGVPQSKIQNFCELLKDDKDLQKNILNLYENFSKYEKVRKIERKNHRD